MAKIWSIVDAAMVKLTIQLKNRLENLKCKTLNINVPQQKYIL